jgi:spermidine synthase
MKGEAKMSEQETWWRERDEGLGVAHALKMRRLHAEQSAHQEIEIWEHAVLGRVLVLDGLIQAAQADEFLYHEMALHVPLLGRARQGASVLIVGGGDGGALREALVHPFVARVVMVEIDARVIEVSNRFLGLVGTIDDPRAELVVADAAAYVRDAAASGERFDVILLDLTEPVGPSGGLFGEAFLGDLAACLAPGGVVVDSDSLFLTTDGPRFLQELCNDGAPNLVSLMRERRLLPHLASYRATVPVYPGAEFGFFLYSADGHDYSHPVSHYAGRHYTPDIHRAAFALPPWWQALSGRPDGEGDKA